MRKTILVMILAAGCGADAVDSDDSMATFTGNEYEATALPAQLQTGDLVRHGGASVLVPAPGEGVATEALHDDGTADTLQVAVDDSGAVTVTTGEPRLAPGATQVSELARIPSACSDDRYNHIGFRWFYRYDWAFQAASTPRGISRDLAEQQIHDATLHITQEHNNCGRADRISATQHYLGRTSRGTNVTAAGTCGNRDGHNVTGFADFDANHSGVLAVTCTWWVTRSHSSITGAVESDTRISKNETRWWSTGACNNRFSLEAVMTHERGHTFGLAHVSASSYLTMNPYVSPCDKRDITLGLGDMIGLERLY